MKAWGWVVIISGLVAFATSVFVVFDRLGKNVYNQTIATPLPATAIVFPSPSPSPQTILLDVPFMVQAPRGQWSNPLFEDGCEEASILMAWHWIKGTTLTEAQVADEIIKISAYEDTTYGPAQDRSAADTAKLMQDYFGYTKIRVAYDVTAPDIIAELQQGHIVITPMDGRALKNPFYTPPGPERHMVVIRGYDPTTKEFITNDGGTKRGAGYRYGQQRLLSSIRDYPTGNHKPITTTRTAMIVVGK